MKLNYIKELDGVRALAALSIMYLHFSSTIQPVGLITNFIHKTSALFQIGVPLFFVLSGFLITRILLQSKQKKRYFQTFYTKRALRIFPLYYLVILLVVFVIPYLTNGLPSSFLSFWPNLFYLQNIFISFGWPYEGPNHFWSLAVEEHFYLFWPVIIYFVQVSWVKRLILFILILEPLLRYFLLQHQIDVYYFTFTRLDELVLGAFLALKEIEIKKIGKQEIWFGSVLAIFALIAFFFLSGLRINVMQVLKYSIFAYLFYLVVGMIALNKMKYMQFLNLKVLSYTGKISYGLYILHPICFGLIDYYLDIQQLFLKFIVYFSSAYLVSSISYYAFESYFLQLKAKLIA